MLSPRCRRAVRELATRSAGRGLHRTVVLAVTIYGPNDASKLPCPSAAHFIELARCFPASSWEYYSIDGCTSPNTDSSAQSSASISSSSSTATTAPTAFVGSSSIAASPPRNVGAIAGGVVGGVVLFFGAAAAAFFFLPWRQQHRQNKGRESGVGVDSCSETSSQDELDSPDHRGSRAGVLVELSSNLAVPELPTRDAVVYRAELADCGSDLPEMQKLRPPVELSADEVGRDCVRRDEA
ncbi:hypothetical protein LTS18_008648 [Coniosporium uncinatum]|uniref:Uncharacterized protein n=1 Tax=Coniosporium uncinatum TaxID=93489 RepID=A0ACC3DA54_9PEZI|nr:hypothetical protein LTS18_008648 [Coniosporium uncinatum]